MRLANFINPNILNPINPMNPINPRVPTKYRRPLFCCFVFPPSSLVFAGADPAILNQTVCEGTLLSEIEVHVLYGLYWVS